MTRLPPGSRTRWLLWGPGNSVGIYAIKPAFQRRLIKARDLCIRAGVGADALTWTALLLSIGGGAALTLSDRLNWLLLLVPVFAMGRIVLNALDGMVATATGTARPFGEVFNEFADRLSDTAWFAGLAFVIDPRLALGSLIVVLLSSYLGTVAKAAGGPRIYGGIMGKADRMIAFSLLASIAYFSDARVLEILAWAVGVGAIITILQRAIAARKALTSEGRTHAS